MSDQTKRKTLAQLRAEKKQRLEDAKLGCLLAEELIAAYDSSHQDTGENEEEEEGRRRKRKRRKQRRRRRMNARCVRMSLMATTTTARLVLR
jgi:hypothetical protein